MLLETTCTSLFQEIVNNLKWTPLKRNTVIDITKAIGILLVILGHCGAMPYRHFIFTFHMPLFFILSGYFFKSKDIKTSMKSDLQHLMIPYFVTCGAVVLLTSVKSMISRDFSPVFYYVEATFFGSGSPHSCQYLAYLPSIGAIWFFPALLVCKNVYNALSCYPVKKRLLFSAIIYVVATLIGRYIIFIPFSVLCGLSAIIFYAIGDYYKKEKPQIKWIYWIVGLFCWGISSMFSIVLLVQPRTDLYLIDVIGATTATFMVYKISAKISKLFPKSDLLPWIGRNTIYILCFHLIDLDLGVSNMITHNMYPVTLIMSMLIIPLVATFVWTMAYRRWMRPFGF